MNKIGAAATTMGNESDHEEAVKNRNFEIVRCLTGLTGLHDSSGSWHLFVHLQAFAVPFSVSQPFTSQSLRPLSFSLQDMFESLY